MSRILSEPKSLFEPPRRTLLVDSPILPPDRLRELSNEILGYSTSETFVVQIGHRATGVARVARGKVRLADNGDDLFLSLLSQFGRRVRMVLNINQIDSASLRDAVRYLERVASQQPGDPVLTAMPIPPRTYLPNTTWKESTVTAFAEERHKAIEELTAPVLDAGLLPAVFVGVQMGSRSYADKQGLFAAGQECDSEMTVTAWNADGKGSGWAGAASRDWSTLKPAIISGEATRLTKLAANPVAVEPGRRVAILDRPAVAQLVATMGRYFDAQLVFAGRGPLYDRVKRGPRFGQRVMDPRLTMSSDPNDPDGGYMPFNQAAYPQVPMTWIEGGVLKNLAYSTFFAAQQGVSPANDFPSSIRMSGGPTSVEEMIANCKEGVYVNRLSQVQVMDFDSGAAAGFTTGACFVIKDGRIDKSVKHFRIFESPWHLFNRLEAVGPSERTTFGFSPWHGGWPLPPMIVPPMMVRDFNFAGLAEAV